jgi:hypothetical protein
LLTFTLKPKPYKPQSTFSELRLGASNGRKVPPEIQHLGTWRLTLRRRIFVRAPFVALLREFGS